MNTYRIYWNDYSYEDVKGVHLLDALLRAGYDICDYQSIHHWYIIEQVTKK